MKMRNLDVLHNSDFNFKIVKIRYSMIWFIRQMDLIMSVPPVKTWDCVCDYEDIVYFCNNAL